MKKSQEARICNLTRSLNLLELELVSRRDTVAQRTEQMEEVTADVDLLATRLERMGLCNDSIRSCQVDFILLLSLCISFRFLYKGHLRRLDLPEIGIYG
jgi:hypothetical protein